MKVFNKKKSFFPLKGNHLGEGRKRVEGVTKGGT